MDSKLDCFEGLVKLFLISFDMENLTDYFDIANNNLQNLSIDKKDSFSCQLVGSDGKLYLWFILWKSQKWNSYTICGIDFHPNDDWKFQPRLTFRRTSKELQDAKVRNDVSFQRISFQTWDDWYKEFWQMIEFLYSFKELVDIGSFRENFKIINTDDFIVWFQNKQEAEKISDLWKIITSANLSPEQMVNLSANIIYEQRKSALVVFELLLQNTPDINWKTYIDSYKEIHSLNERGEEIAWHHFLKNNPWILGLNLDIKFIRDFISEWNLGIPDTDWKWSPKVDLIWLSDYTVLVELKTANKKIFTEKKKETGRANTWSFSDDFIDGISQCLAQKTEWDKCHKTKNLVENGNVINQDKTRTLDSECIFIIWNKEQEISVSSTKVDDFTKRDVFQRYRINSKNVKIITFDELHERAKKILDI